MRATPALKRILRTEFIGVVESYIGTPVVHRGRIPHVGLDCVGLPIAACRQLGLDVAEPDAYPKLPDGEVLRAGLMKYCTPIPTDQIIPGDLLQIYAGKQPRHIVVYTGLNKCGQPVVVHAWGKNSIVQRTLLDVTVFAAWAINGMT